MDQQSTTANPANGASTGHELFVLTDEQILEIEPQEEVASEEWRVAGGIRPAGISSEARTSSLGAPLAPRKTPSSPEGRQATQFKGGSSAPSRPRDAGETQSSR